MGNSLDGIDIGMGFSQRKDSIYVARKEYADGTKIYLKNKDLNKLKILFKIAVLQKEKEIKIKNTTDKTTGKTISDEKNIENMFDEKETAIFLDIDEKTARKLMKTEEFGCMIKKKYYSKIDLLIEWKNKHTLLSVKETALLLGVPYDYAKAIMENETFTRMKNGRLYSDKAELEKWIKAQKKQKNEIKLFLTLKEACQYAEIHSSEASKLLEKRSMCYYAGEKRLFIKYELDAWIQDREIERRHRNELIQLRESALKEAMEMKEKHQKQGEEHGKIIKR